jgi:hypothetical protein
MIRTSTIAFAVLAVGCSALSACNRPSRSHEGRSAASSAVASISPSGELPKCQPVACTPTGSVGPAGEASAAGGEAAYANEAASSGDSTYAANARYAGRRHARAHASRASYRYGSSSHARRYASRHGGAHYGATGGRTAHYGYVDEPLDRSAYDDRYAKVVHMSGYSRGWSDRHEWTPSTGVYEEHRAWGPDRRVHVERHGVPSLARGRYEGHGFGASGGSVYEKRVYGPNVRIERRIYGAHGCPPGAWLDRWGRCAAGSNEVRLDNGFFYDTGGVGPAFVSSGGGGGFVVVGSSSRSSASASAFASARARAHVSVHGRFHGGGKGCGACGGHGGHKGGHGGH